MYCPNCSQEIASSDLRFCPRCGLPLAGVQQLLAANGSSEKLAEPPPVGLRVFRRREYRLPAKLIFFSIVAVPLAIILSIIFDSPGPLAIPFLIFLAGITTLSYTFLFGRG